MRDVFDVPLKPVSADGRARERERGSVTGDTVCCVAWNIFLKAAVEVGAENELRAVILFIQGLCATSSLFQSLGEFCKQNKQKGDFPARCLIVHEGRKT